MKLQKIDASVSLANELVRAAHCLKLVEKRLLMLALTRIDSKQAATGRNQSVTLSAADYLAEYDADKPSSYREIAAAVNSLDAARVRFKDTAIGEYGSIHWTTGARYKPKQGLFVISINGDLLPYLMDLKSHFTTYKLSRVSGFKSIYSWRLFELLMQFKRTGLLTILIDDFYHSMEAPESLRANFANLRNRVIEPAVKEIREKDGLAIEWEAIKAGRKVKALKFTFPTEQQLILDTHPKALNSANTPRTEQQAEQGAKAKKGAKQEIEAFLSLSETKSRLQSAKELARLAKVPAETYLTEKDRASIAHYELTI